MHHQSDADWLSVCEAREVILGSVAPLSPERRPLLDCLNGVLAEDLVSPLDLPPWDNSAMDGFAVHSGDVHGATEDQPHELAVVEDIAAGGFPTRAIAPGEAARIMTGAPVPAGADGVVRVEHTDGGSAIGTPEAKVRIFSDTDAGKNIRRRGEDLHEGVGVLGRGAVLGPAGIGVAASIGRSQLAVIRRPRVAVLASGDELVDLDGFAEVLAGRRIVSSNSYTLAAQLRSCGAEPLLLGIAADDPRELRAHLERARGCDALITSAGVSVGEHDHLREVMVRELGAEIAFWRVRMRPGSPLAFGRIAGLGGIPWFGLPGNPVSTMVTFEVFVRPALLRMAGHTALFAPTVPVSFAGDYPARPGLTHFARVRLHHRADGVITAKPTGAQGSHILTSMAAADALAVVPEEHAGARTGDLLPALRLGGAALQEQPGY